MTPRDVTQPEHVTGQDRGQPSGRGQPIVVGVDGSPSSIRALRWALRQASLIGAPVEAIIAWQDPAIYGLGYGWTQATFDTESLGAAAEKTMADSIAQVTTEQGPGVPVAPRVVQGHPAQVLLEAARSAQLLVVGSRGHGTLAGMLLGSVSQHCVQHGSCPVLVVPAVPHTPQATAPDTAG